MVKLLFSRKTIMIFWLSGTIVWVIGKRVKSMRKKYDERYKLRVADIKETFKDERMQVEIDAEYNRKINELYTKIGMK